MPLVMGGGGVCVCVCVCVMVSCSESKSVMTEAFRKSTVCKLIVHILSVRQEKKCSSFPINTLRTQQSLDP